MGQSIPIVFIQLVFTLFMYTMGILFFGAALVPALVLFLKVWNATLHYGFLPRIFAIALVISTGYFIFGITLVLLVGLFRMIFNIRLKEGEYPMYSFEALKWSFCGCLFLMVHYTFIDFILLTPFANLLFRMLGAKLGKNVQFNSKYVFDASLLEIGDNTVVGGGAIINGHIVERGKLILKKVKIGKNVLLGSHCTIMPGCEIGDRAIIGASAVLLKDSKVAPRDVWFGLPAESLREKKRKEMQERNDNENKD
ncbi:MAG: hypothetical protein HZA28_07350 [Candidatus Omnitrophica bacterium]|nr:hypothetical protein [Candidatus Omnitrophota bacterium]